MQAQQQAGILGGRQAGRQLGRMTCQQQGSAHMHTAGLASTCIGSQAGLQALHGPILVAGMGNAPQLHEAHVLVHILRVLRGVLV
jgi:hypothetical protein